MQRYILIRILQGLVTLVALSMVIFIVPRATGDPSYIMVTGNPTEQDIADYRQKAGLDRSLIVQYGIFMGDLLTGDLGESLVRTRPVRETIMARFPATLKLAVPTFVFAFTIGLILGIFCAIKRNRLPDLIGRTVAILGQSLPGFWVGIMLILIFSVRLDLLPTGGMGGPSHYVLPVMTMGFYMLSSVTRLTRSSMLEVLRSDYVAFARARGTPESIVLLKHALRNAAIPIVTMATIIFAYSLTGSVVTELVFAWPGVGRLAYEAILMRDYPVIQGIVLIFGVIFIAANLLADILYAWIDPRIRYGRP